MGAAGFKSDARCVSHQGLAYNSVDLTLIAFFSCYFYKEKREKVLDEVDVEAAPLTARLQGNLKLFLCAFCWKDGCSGVCDSLRFSLRFRSSYTRKLISKTRPHLSRNINHKN